MRTLASRGFVVVLLLASLIGGDLSGSFGAGSRAHAQEPAFILYGSVASGSQPLPARVGATIGDVACGSAEVSAAGDGAGFYAIVVVSADTKPGCGVEGAVVRLTLQSGEIDPGVVTTQVLFRPGGVVRLDLSSVSTVIAGALVGDLPVGPGQAYLRWTGPSATPVEQALRTVRRRVQAVYFWDVVRQEFRQYVVGANEGTQTYTLMDTDDIVLVRVE